MAGTPNTSVRNDHAVSIRANGKIIGLIQDFSPQQARTVAHSYEINSAAPGVVYENIPGVATGLTIGITRIDLFSTKMEEAWGPGYDLTMLTNQHNPLTIMEWWENPIESPIYKDVYAEQASLSPVYKKVDTDLEVWVYEGCWFTSLGRQLSANGDRIVRVNASLIYKRKYQLSSSKANALVIANQVTKAIKQRLKG